METKTVLKLFTLSRRLVGLATSNFLCLAFDGNGIS